MLRVLKAPALNMVQHNTAAQYRLISTVKTSTLISLNRVLYRRKQWKECVTNCETGYQKMRFLQEISRINEKKLKRIEEVMPRSVKGSYKNST